MPADLATSSAVIVAHDLNISILKPVWLGREGILSDDELSGDIVVAPAIVRIPTDKFELLVLPDRVQMRLGEDRDDAQANLLRVLGGIVGKLPHTPFTGLGLNFEYRIWPTEGTCFEEWNKQQFGAPFSLSATREAPEDVRYGGYFTMTVLTMDLRVDFKPTRAAGTAAEKEGQLRGPVEAIHAKFNFHRDLVAPGSDARVSVGEILQVLGHWSAAANHASKVAASVIGGRGEE